MKKVWSYLLCFFIFSGLYAEDKWDFFPDTVKTIAIIAPGMPAARTKADKAVSKLRAAGYNVKVMPNARLNESPSKINKVPCNQRLSDLMAAWFDPEVDAIWCMRGGNHAQELTRVLDYDKLRKKPMIIIGFSNITTLHQGLQKNNVGRVFSGPSVTSMLHTDAASRAWFKKCLAGDALSPVQLTALRPGRCSGKATGGHIQMLQWAVQNGYALPTAGRIVFLETSRKGADVNRRCLNSLIKRKYFDGCQAVVFGEFNKMSETAQLELFREFAQKVKCPVFYGYPYGHGTANFLIDMDRVKTIGDDAVLRQ